ncbi:oxygen-insensitive NADPH nitroreductase [Moraxella marmotae]|uniref:oxygen-insensitive NADPH nitroreductase n=1 Tax=Moraxella marmotae TaxID=3344520 RepID=UPI0035F2A8B6
MLDSKPTLQTLLEHRSIRKYTGEPISDEILLAVLEAGRAVSTSSFLQAASVIRVVDKAKRTALRQISCDMSEQEYEQAVQAGKRLGHAYVEDCAEYLVFCMDSHRHHQLADVQTDWTEVAIIGAIDAALMAQNVLAAAESLGLGGVYIGSLRNDIQRAGQVLGLPQHVVPLFGLCLGHPDMSSKVNQSQRPRLPLDVLVSTDTYQAASDADLAAYNEVVREYYQGRGLDLDWKAQIAATFGGEVRPFMLDYLQQQGFCKR